MTRVSKKLLGGSGFNQCSEIHHGNVITDVCDHTEVMADEQERQSHLTLKGLQQIEDIRLNGDIKGGNTFVRNNKVWTTHQCACN